jgi:hypothetical protein
LWGINICNPVLIQGLVQLGANGIVFSCLIRRHPSAIKLSKQINLLLAKAPACSRINRASHQRRRPLLHQRCVFFTELGQCFHGFRVLLRHVTVATFLQGH